MKKKLLKLTGIVLIFLFSLSGSSQTAGTLTFRFTTPVHSSGNYETNGRYVLAVWLESCATCGSGTTVGTSTFVRTKIRNWGSNTTDHLPTWNTKSAGSTTGMTTGATLSTFVAKTVTWDGTDAAGTTLLADGNYRVCIQETWGHGAATATRYFPFTKGPSTDSQTPTADTNFTAISLVWMSAATLSNENFTQKPEAVVYPNPTKGIFYIDLKNEITKIKIINLLGEVIYTENVDGINNGASKSVNLSNFSNGMYIVNVSNDLESISYKVILNK